MGQNDDKEGREGKEKRPDSTATIKSNPASETAPDATITDPLVRVLVSKGILNNDEGKSINGGGTPIEQRERLAELLRDKGVISASEFEALRAVRSAQPESAQPESSAGVQERRPGAVQAPGPNTVQVAVQTANQQSAGPQPAYQPPANQQAANQQPANQQSGGPGKPPAAAAPPRPAAAQTPVIAAIAPIRALQSEPSRHDGLIPDLKLGSGGKIKFYGFLKTSAVYDSSSPLGNDFPLPGFLTDTGPDAAPEFHVKARSLRLGANFEWPDASPKTAITGRVEFDFEGSFTRSNNRNISTVRSSQPSIRLAYGRIDRALSENTSAFALFGQDWTPFGSSTLPNIIEITGLGLGYGTLYERAPQTRFGVNFKVPGNSRGLRFQPEFALVLPAFGNTPLNVADQEGFGERQGADSAQPELQGRFVTQWQLDKAPGVVPAQLIASWVWAKRKVIARAADVPVAFRGAFPTGAEVESDRWGYSLEAQLPTRAVTLLVKYYRGGDLRFYFANQLFSSFTDTLGLTGVATGNSIDGSSTAMAYGFRDGVPVVAPQEPVRGQGGFVNLGFPLSRIFKANPEGRHAGWTAYLHYGIDQAFARDVRRFAAPGRGKSDLAAATIYYRFNNWLTFGYEQSYYRTRAFNSTAAAALGLPLFRGIPSRETHNLRSEFATIFTF